MFSNMGEMQITMGLLDKAVAQCDDAILAADKSEDSYACMVTRITSADAFMQSGNHQHAKAQFEKAEAPQYPQFLMGLAGFRYADLMLHPVEVAAWRAATHGGNGTVSSDAPQLIETCYHVDNRAKWNIELALEMDQGLLSAGLQRLTLARSALYFELVRLGDMDRKTSIETTIGLAHSEVLKTNDAQYLPLALLTAAFYHGTLGENLVEAERLLEETQQIAERGPMPLYLADVHLHRARLFGRQTKKERENKFPDVDPKAELIEARCLIEKHGYWRRKEELEDAEAAAIHW